MGIISVTASHSAVTDADWTPMGSSMVGSERVCICGSKASGELGQEFMHLRPIC